MATRSSSTCVALNSILFIVVFSRAQNTGWGKPQACHLGQAALTDSVAWREHVGLAYPDVSCDLPTGFAQKARNPGILGVS
jgi:hypothetical protein